MVFLSVGILVCIWAGLGIYVFLEIKKTYDRGRQLSQRFLVIWFIMWGFHHLSVILSSSYSLWLIPINRAVALAGGLVIIVIGVAILVVGMVEFRSLRRSTGQDTSKLMTSGIYRWSRNPQFIGWFLALLGILLIGCSGLAFALTMVFAVVIHLYTTRMEEPYLERIFGEGYRMYKLKTARYVGIPEKREE